MALKQPFMFVGLRQRHLMCSEDLNLSLSIQVIYWFTNMGDGNSDSQLVGMYHVSSTKSHLSRIQRGKHFLSTGDQEQQFPCYIILSQKCFIQKRAKQPNKTIENSKNNTSQEFPAHHHPAKIQARVVFSFWRSLLPHALPHASTWSCPRVRGIWATRSTSNEWTVSLSPSWS